MYRLNKWTASAAPWLADDTWETTTRSWEPTGYLAAGLDLSKTRDMSALNLTYCEDGKRFQKTALWITEEYAEANRAKVRFHEWADRGYVTIIPGDVILISWIKEYFASMSDDIELLVYDKTYAQEFTEWVMEQYPGIECVEFPQSPSVMEGPIDGFEAALLAGELFHDDNPCMTWQAGHCEVRENARGHRILQKPKRGDVRKIDGLVASVMGFYGATVMPSPVSGSLFIS